MPGETLRADLLAAEVAGDEDRAKLLRKIGEAQGYIPQPTPDESMSTLIRNAASPRVDLFAHRPAT